MTTSPQATSTHYWHQSPRSVQFCLIKWPVLSLAHLINSYLLSWRIFVTKADTGMKDASIAPNAITLWWKSLLLPRMSACCAQSATLTSAPPSASTARRPSCRVRSQGSSGLSLNEAAALWTTPKHRKSIVAKKALLLRKTSILCSLDFILCILEIKGLFCRGNYSVGVNYNVQCIFMKLIHRDIFDHNLSHRMKIQSKPITLTLH